MIFFEKYVNYIKNMLFIENFSQNLETFGKE